MAFGVVVIHGTRLCVWGRRSLCQFRLHAKIHLGTSCAEAAAAAVVEPESEAAAEAAAGLR